MDRLAWMGFLLFAAACAPDLQAGGSGGAGGGGGGAGGMATSSSSSTGGMMGMPCAADAECSGLDTECQQDGLCVDGFCQWTFVAAQTPIAMQVYGDCKTLACDGKGATIASVDVADTYVWGNPCYAPTCGIDMPLPSSGTACTTEWGTSGTCQVDFSCSECTGDANCSGGTSKCQNGKCVPAQCINGIKEPLETDVDCGGQCALCDIGKMCTSYSDCVDGGKCTGNPKFCQAPDCADALKNGDETGVDCGGACAMAPTNLKCPTNSGCLYPSDCQSDRCEAGVCK